MEDKPMINTKELEEQIGYQFKDKAHLKMALTHSSYSNESRDHKKENNERMEYLGDAVLEVSVSDYLYHTYPEKNEGELTKIRSSLVCERTLSLCARDISLGKYLRLSKGEHMTGGRERDSILSDAFEALIGAIYLDGGMEEARKFIDTYLLQDVEDKTLFYDAKTILQEMVQADTKKKLSYHLVKEDGPDHCKEFTVETWIGDEPIATGVGRTKKAAEQMAAYKTILLQKNK
jgi:ribonuclease-3